MHCSIWTYHGDPDDLAAKYEAMLAQVPLEAMQFSMYLRTPDGIVIVDTCPSKEVFDGFWASEGLQALLDASGLGRPDTVVDHPVLGAFSGGTRIAGGEVD